MRAIALILLTLTTLAPVAAEKAVILDQKDCPLTITLYKTKYREPANAGSLIEHAVTYRLTSNKEVVAVRFGLVSFNSFDEFMDKFGGYAIDTLKPGKEVESVFNDSPYAASEFQRYGTGAAYVDAVRFSDGTVWHADEEEVLSGIRKVDDAFKKENLKEKDKPGA